MDKVVPGRQRQQTGRLSFGKMTGPLMIIVWTAIFLYPGIWHATVPEDIWLNLDWHRSKVFWGDGCITTPYLFLIHRWVYPVHHAAMKNRTEWLQAAGLEKQKLARTDFAGLTPLEYATFFRRPACCKILLEAGAPTEVRGESDSTPLLHAMNLGNIEMIMLLLDHGAKLDAPGENWVTPLHRAAMSGFLVVIERLPAGEISIDCHDREGRTPMDRAIQAGNLPMVIALAMKGASYQNCMEPADPLIQAYLALCKKTGDPRKAGAILAEDSVNGLFKRLQNRWYFPAEFPVDDKPVQKYQSQ